MLRFGDVLINEHWISTVTLTNRGTVIQMATPADVPLAVDDERRLIPFDNPEGERVAAYFREKYPDLLAPPAHAAG